MIQVRKATRQKSKLRLALIGASGTGKTYSALQIAKGIGNKILLVDTENGSGDLYAHLTDYNVAPIQAPYTPAKYIEAIEYAEKEGYDVIILDSLSHAWSGEGGLLDQQGSAADKSGNSWTAWRTVTPQHNQMIDAIVQSNIHVIATVRAKTEHVQEKDERTGKTVVRKIGMAPIQRDGLEYEFTVVFDIDYNHKTSATKDRTSLFENRYIVPTPELGAELKNWLESGVEVVKPITWEIAAAELKGTETKEDFKKIYNKYPQFRNFRGFNDVVKEKTKEFAPETDSNTPKSNEVIEADFDPTEVNPGSVVTDKGELIEGKVSTPNEQSIKNIRIASTYKGLLGRRDMSIKSNQGVEKSADFIKAFEEMENKLLEPVLEKIEEAKSELRLVNIQGQLDKEIVESSKFKDAYEAKLKLLTSKK